MTCPYMQRCADFLGSLGLSPAYMDQRYDRCYCPSCADAKSIPDVLEKGSKHGFAYEVPKGWCGFGLKLPPRADALNIFENWAVSFHGCPRHVVPSVLQEGRLMMPGDRLMDGTQLANRLTGGGEDGAGKGRIGLYTSPSILYSELEIYTQPQGWNGSKVSLVFQCRQDMTLRPPALRIEGETIGWEHRFGDVPISSHFPNSQIERYTDASNSIIPYRILVAMNVVTREAEEQMRAHRQDGSEEEVCIWMFVCMHVYVHVQGAHLCKFFFFVFCHLCLCVDQHRGQQDQPITYNTSSYWTMRSLYTVSMSNVYICMY